MKITKEVEVKVTAKAILQDGALSVTLDIGVPFGAKNTYAHHAETITGAEADAVQKALQAVIDKHVQTVLPKAERGAHQCSAAAQDRKEEV